MRKFEFDEVLLTKEQDERLHKKSCTLDIFPRAFGEKRLFAQTLKVRCVGDIMFHGMFVYKCPACDGKILEEF